jgi:hypothetical protein
MLVGSVPPPGVYSTCALSYPPNRAIKSILKSIEL